MKVLLTGAGGLLGHDLWGRLEKFHEVSAIGRTQPAYVLSPQWRAADLTDEEAVYRIVSRDNPDLVIHTAAYNDVDGAERHPDDAYRVNALACRNLAAACQRFDTVLMSVSSDYVFDGVEPPAGGYREFDACHPVSRYGESKYWGERFVGSLLNKFFIVRTAWLFGPGRATWVDRVAAAVREQAEIKAVRDMVGSPTYTPDLADAMIQLIDRRSYGIYHLTNSGSCSRVELAQEVARLVAPEETARIRVLTQAELGLPARRPPNSTLQNLYWRLNGHEPLRDWKKALARHFQKNGAVRKGEKI